MSRFSPHRVIALNDFEPCFDYGPGYRRWLGGDELNDLNECLAKAQPPGPSLWVVDHYGIGVGWEKGLVNRGDTVLTIDDLSRAHSTTIVLDQNITADLASYRTRSLAEKRPF